MLFLSVSNFIKLFVCYDVLSMLRIPHDFFFSLSSLFSIFFFFFIFEEHNMIIRIAMNTYIEITLWFYQKDCCQRPKAITLPAEYRGGRGVITRPFPVCIMTTLVMRDPCNPGWVEIGQDLSRERPLRCTGRISLRNSLAFERLVGYVEWIQIYRIREY